MADTESPWSPLFLALRLAWNLGYIIALPAALFGFGGAFLDKEFNTSPLFILIGFCVAITLSTIGVYRIIKQINLPR